jgi:hypothetical protein
MDAEAEYVEPPALDRPASMLSPLTLVRWSQPVRGTRHPARGSTSSGFSIIPTGRCRMQSALISCAPSAKREAMVSTQALDGLRRPGWLTFAAVILVSVGIVRVISAIYYFADSTRVNNLSGGAFGHHLFLWGLWDLLIALLALTGGFSLFGGNTFGRVIGYAWAILVIVQSFLIISSAPWFGSAALLLAVLVIYALSSTSEWRETA